jgi:phenylalanyl-tRNA synthetase beta chain
MNISYNWLKEFIDFKWTVKELADKLTFAGIEVEAIDDIGGLSAGSASLTTGPLGDRDWRLGLEITPNRPDCLSLLGLAREIRALNNGKINIPESVVKETGPDVNTLASVGINDKQGCPRYLARVITGVNVAESPDWLKQKIESIGLRPINNVADITNLVLYEFGHPLHAFDYDKLAGHKIIVRRARANEAMVSIDGTERKLSPEYLVIADAQKAVAVAGVMGGLESEISNATRNVLLESAYFDPPLIRRGSRNLGLKTDASYRFERGADPHILRTAADRAARLMAEIAGGTVAQGVIDVTAREFPATWELQLRPERARSLLGADIADAKMAEILNALELKAAVKDKSITVQVPSFRADLTREADLIEEVGRIHGYDNLKTGAIAPWAVPGVKRPKEAAGDRVIDAMVSLGCCQHYGLPLADPSTYAKLGTQPPLVELDNPLSSDLSALRAMLLPDLLEAGIRNINNGQENLKLFECGLVFSPGQPAPAEALHLGILACGSGQKQSWDRPAQGYDLYDLKGMLEVLFEDLKIGNISYSSEHKTSRPFLHPGRSFEIRLKDKAIGWAGELDAAVNKNLDLKHKLYCAELELELLITLLAGAVPQFGGLPKFPAVKRDLAIMVPQQVANQSISEAIAAAGGDILEKAELFDLYSGGQIEKGQKSLAYSLSYRHPERTLTDAEVNRVHQGIIEALTGKLGARIR